MIKSLLFITFKSIFNDEYYQKQDSAINGNNSEEDDKPVFTDDDEEDLKCKYTIVFTTSENEKSKLCSSLRFELG